MLAVLSCARSDPALPDETVPWFPRPSPSPGLVPIPDVARDPRAEIAAWKSAPTRENAQRLAAATYPEFVGARGPELAFDVDEAEQVLTLRTRGRTFVVRRTSPSRGVFLLPAGPGRIEEFEVLARATQHRARYEVMLEGGTVRAAANSDYVALSDADGVPLLRMHQPEVRDARGTRRRGRFALESSGTGLVATLYLDLAGLEPPCVVDPGWSSTGVMSTPRSLHTATLLTNGKVLIVGGRDAVRSLASAELYDPQTGTFSAVAPMGTRREAHTATLLRSGRVLVTGGIDSYPNQIRTKSAELYDPQTNAWTTIATTMAVTRQLHAAVLLPSGKVLITGGHTQMPVGFGGSATADLYDPETQTIQPTVSMGTGRFAHTATVLRSGEVVVAGGWGPAGLPAGGVTSVERYDPITESWTDLPALSTRRTEHSATLLADGRLLMMGGSPDPGPVEPVGEVYDPATNAWTSTGSTVVPRYRHGAALLPSNHVVIAGGDEWYPAIPDVALRFDPVSLVWAPLGAPLITHHQYGTLTMLPSGKLLLAGGFDPSAGTGGTTNATCEVLSVTDGRWTYGGSFTVMQQGSSTQVLPSGRVLLAGTDQAFRSAEVYDPATNQSSATGPMTIPRPAPALALLRSGKVLAAGGPQQTGPSAEIFEPDTMTWRATQGPALLRVACRLTVLANGHVLLTGGTNPVTLSQNQAEIFDPDLEVWRPTAPMIRRREGHVAVLLADGKVLVAGGNNSSCCTEASAEIYDPVAETWTAVPPMHFSRGTASAVRLRSGKVFVVGGHPNGPVQAEVFDPAAKTWTLVANTAGPGFLPSALLPSGRVLVGPWAYQGEAIYDPATNALDPAREIQAQADNRLTLLPSGKVMLSLSSGAGYFDETDADDLRRPVVTGPTTAAVGKPLVITGQRLMGLPGGSTGRFNDSPANAPLLSLVSLHNPYSVALAATQFSDQAVTVDVPTSVLPGFYLLFVEAAGIAGGRVLHIPDLPPTIMGGAATTTEDLPVDLVVHAADPEGLAVSYRLVGLPKHGTLTGTLPAVRYVPDPNFAGHDEFALTARDGHSEATPAVFSIDVDPINDPPTLDAIADQSAARGSGTLSVVLTGVGPGGGADEAAQGLTLSAISSRPAHIANPIISGAGSTRTLAVDVDAWAQGVVAIRVMVRDSEGAQVERSFSITVTPVNHAPEALPALYDCDGTPIAITLMGSDLDGDPLTYSVGTPGSGTLQGTPPNLTYVPAAGFDGLDAFYFSVSDGAVTSPQVGVYVQVDSKPPACATTGGGVWLAALVLVLVLTRARRRRGGPAHRPPTPPTCGDLGRGRRSGRRRCAVRSSTCRRPAARTAAHPAAPALPAAPGSCGPAGRPRSSRAERTRCAGGTVLSPTRRRGSRWSRRCGRGACASSAGAGRSCVRARAGRARPPGRPPCAAPP